MTTWIRHFQWVALVGGATLWECLMLNLRVQVWSYLYTTAKPACEDSGHQNIYVFLEAMQKC